ncbi:hypothetical protein [Arthrobacter psychrolactophilus]
MVPTRHRRQRVLIAGVSSAIGQPAGFLGSSPAWIFLILFGVLQYARTPYPLWVLTGTRFLARKLTGQTTYFLPTEALSPSALWFFPEGSPPWTSTEPPMESALSWMPRDMRPS